MDVQQAVQVVRDAAHRGEYYPQTLRGLFGPDDGYRIQLGVLDAHLEAGQRQAGWKVGLTAKAIQEQQNYHEPVFGYLLERGAMPLGSAVRCDELLKPGAEPELCVRLGQPLQGPGVTPDAARAAIAAVAPALEVIEVRGVFTDDPSLALADNVGQKGFVTGAWQEGGGPWDSASWGLAGARLTLRINGEEMDAADGTAVLGDPAASLAFLANRLADFGRRVEAGSVVMTGSFTRMYPLAPGDEVVAHFKPFGPVSVRAT